MHTSRETAFSLGACAILFLFLHVVAFGGSWKFNRSGACLLQSRALAIARVRFTPYTFCIFGGLFGRGVFGRGAFGKG